MCVFFAVDITYIVYQWALGGDVPWGDNEVWCGLGESVDSEWFWELLKVLGTMRDSFAFPI